MLYIKAKAGELIMYETAKAVIGMIVMGASAAVESEFHKNVPDHIQIATTRVPIGEVSYDGLKTMTNALPDAARLLMETCPDMIIVTNMTGAAYAEQKLSISSSRLQAFLYWRLHLNS